MSEEKILTVKMTRQEAWALIRITALAQDSDRVDMDDKSPAAWVGRRIHLILAEDLDTNI